MLPEFFDIENGKVKLSPNVLLVPVFKSIYDTYGLEESLNVFSVIWYCYHPKSPYCNLDQDSKWDKVCESLKLKDYYKYREDPLIIGCMDFINEHMLSPTMKYYLSQKRNIEQMSAYAKVPITDGKDGNLPFKIKMIENCGKAIQSFMQLEDIIDKEVEKSRNVGGRKQSTF
jgi:hypothetical protein